MAVAHVTLDLRLGNQRGDAVHDDDVDGSGPDQGFADVQSLFAVVGL